MIKTKLSVLPTCLRMLGSLMRRPFLPVRLKHRHLTDQRVPHTLHITVRIVVVMVPEEEVDPALEVRVRDIVVDITVALSSNLTTLIARTTQANGQEEIRDKVMGHQMSIIIQIQKI